MTMVGSRLPPAMDTETSEAIETLRADLRHLEDTLGGRIDALGVRVDGVEARLGSKIEAVDAKIDRVEATLRVEMGQMRGDMRHQFEIATESSRDDIRIIAEGFIALNAKVDRLLP